MATLLKKITLLLLTATVLLAFLSCGDDDEPDTPQLPTTDNKEPEAPPLPSVLDVVSADGKTDFVIVYDYRSENAMNAAYFLRDKIHELCGVNIVAKASNLQSPKANEIIIGDLERMPSEAAAIIEQKASAYYMRYFEVRDGKLSIYATSFEAYTAAIEYITETFIADGEFCTPVTYSRLVALTPQQYADGER